MHYVYYKTKRPHFKQTIYSLQTESCKKKIINKFLRPVKYCLKMREIVNILPRVFSYFIASQMYIWVFIQQNGFLFDL